MDLRLVLVGEDLIRLERPHPRGMVAAGLGRSPAARRAGLGVHDDPPGPGLGAERGRGAQQNCGRKAAGTRYFPGVLELVPEQLRQTVYPSLELGAGAEVLGEIVEPRVLTARRHL